MLHPDLNIFGAYTIFNIFIAFRVIHLLGLPFCSIFVWKRPLKVLSKFYTLKFGDVAKGLESDISPMRIPCDENEALQRPKSGVEFFTFCGRDSIEALKIYVKNMESRVLNADTGSVSSLMMLMERLKFTHTLPINYL